MASSGAPSWQSIVQAKQSYRASLIPKSWLLPANVLPQDPPSPKQGSQSTISIPQQFLSSSELDITESHTVVSLLSAISSRRLSAVDVTTAFCHRAAIAHQLTNCLTEPLFESAIERAKYLDNHLAKYGSVLGPLHGLPVSLKDTFDVSGVDSSIGIASLCFKPASTNAPLVSLLLSLGCVIIAKTNVPQTLGSLDSINNVFGRTMNPLNRLLTAGGSSGGEGVLVAMKGSMIGWGTDIGGSIRIPAMCNGIYGFKPSVGRIPYGGQQGVSKDGIGRTSVQASAGPIGRSVEDIGFVMKEVVPQTKLWAEDCFACGEWNPSQIQDSSNSKEYVIGVLRSDGNCALLPPITNMMNEVVASLKKTKNIRVIEIPTPQAWTKSQSVVGRLMGVDGATYMADLLSSTNEPLVPWLSTRFKKGKPQTLDQLATLQSQRATLERSMLSLWYTSDSLGRRTRSLDAIICPLAAHPIPEIDRYNAVGYTSSWVMLDMPAATVPVRTVQESDLQLGKPLEGKTLSSWDERCRELWDEDKTDRRVYLDSPLCVQVVVMKAEDEKLIKAMKVVDQAVKLNVRVGEVKARL